jgi:PAS domain S-box-containing protein
MIDTGNRKLANYTTSASPPRPYLFRSMKIAFVLVLLVVAIALLVTRYRSHLDQSETRVNAFNAIYSENLQTLLGDLDDVLRATSRQVEAGVQVEGLSFYLQVVASRLPQLRTLLILDENGVVIAESRPDGVAIGIDVSDRPYFLVHTIANNDTPDTLYLDDPVQSLVDGAWSMPSSFAIRDDDGEFLGVAVASIEPNYLAENLLNNSEIQLGTIKGYIINPQGTIWATIPLQSDAMGKDLAPQDLWQNILLQRTQPFTTTNYFGRDVLDEADAIIAHSVVMPYGVGVIFSKHLSDVFALFYAEALFIIGGFFALSGLSIVALDAYVNQVKRIWQQAQVIQQEAHQREQAERDLHQSERAFRALVENSNDFIVRFDSGLRHLFVNRAVVESTGTAFEDYIGKTNEELGRTAESIDFWNTHIRDVFATGEEKFMAFDYDMPAGHRYYQARLMPERDDEGNVQSVLSVVRDITALREAEETRLQAERLQAELDKEHELLELKKHFVALASHDLRTPLSIISTSASMLERYNDRLSPEKRLEKLEHIQTYVGHMTRLLDEILTVSKLEEGRIKPNITPIDLPSFCDQVWDDMLTLHGDTHQTRYKMASSITVWQADALMLRYALNNVLGNAFKYTPEGGMIEFVIEDHQEGDEPWLCFTVRDTGVGIPQDDMANLFQRFQRASNVKNMKGTGLGLSIAYDYVQLHGGTITAESVENEGSTFVMRLPRHADDASPSPNIAQDNTTTS